MYVVYGYQGAEEDPDKLRLTDKFLQAVLAEDQVICIGQPLLIAGDLNADSAVIPCLAKGFSAGRFVDLVRSQMLLANSGGRIVLDLVGTPSWVALMHMFCISRWTADVAYPVVCQPILPACWIDTHDRSSSSVARAVQDAWDVYGDELGVVPLDIVLALRDAVSRSCVHDFLTLWSKSAEGWSFWSVVSGWWSH